MELSKEDARRKIRMTFRDAIKRINKHEAAKKKRTLKIMLGFVDNEEVEKAEQSELRLKLLQIEQQIALCR